MKKLCAIALFASIILVIGSCEKEMIVEEEFSLNVEELRFFDDDELKSGNGNLKERFIETIKNDLSQQNKKKRFISKFVKKYGYPDWEMVRWFKNENEVVAQIPVFKDDGCETNAVILCVQKNENLKFVLFVRDKLSKYKNNKKPRPTLEKIQDLFIIFDFQQYGESSYLPNGRIVNVSENNTSVLKSGGWVWVEYCYDIEVYAAGELLSSRRECEGDYVWATVEYSEEQEGGGGSNECGDWYDEGTGGSSGGDTGEDPEPSTIPVPEIIIDPTFENSIANCVKEKLDREGTLRKLIGGFGIDESIINLTFIVEDLTGSNGKCTYNANNARMEIKIDTDWLNKSSLEIARTILHESFHAYIFGKLHQEELHSGLCPEPNFTDDFEDYINRFEGQAQHNYIANKYISFMKEGLLEYFNFQVDHSEFLNYVQNNDFWYGTDFMLECLSWGGLKKTEAWNNFCGDSSKKLKYDQTMNSIIPFLPKEKCDQ